MFANFHVETLVQRAADIHRWSLALRDSGRPAYLAVADAIGEDIHTGRLAAAERLPPLRVVAEHLHLNYSTVARAYAEAERRGLIESQAGRGTFVRAATPRTGVGPSRASLVEMTMNFPPEPADGALLDRMRGSITELARVADPYDLLRYQEAGGTRADREAGVQWMGPLLPGVSPDRVLVCPGVQGALVAVLCMLARPGDVVCCEALTYPGTKAIAAQLGLELLGLPIDADGIDPDAFERACETYRPKVLYCNPTLLNPTTAIVSLTRREALIAIARRHGVAIVEDDAYGRLPTSAPPPFAALAPERTFHLTGLAKYVGAGLRIAYLAAPDNRQAARLANILRATAVMVSPLTAMLATRWITDGTADAALVAVREESMARQRMLTRHVGVTAVQTHAEAFHAWLSLPEAWTRGAFVEALRSRGIGAVGSDVFAVTESPPEAVRLCLGGPVDRAGLDEAVGVIAGLLAESPRPA